MFNEGFYCSQNFSFCFNELNILKQVAGRMVELKFELKQALSKYLVVLMETTSLIENCALQDVLTKLQTNDLKLMNV